MKTAIEGTFSAVVGVPKSLLIIQSASLVESGGLGDQKFARMCVINFKILICKLFGTPTTAGILNIKKAPGNHPGSF
ncbi:MAG: hypothetical protein IPL53_23370 [Ignavibacteria bacterium]|nr:hypothetical protein [Ignavibacteria bacterium]